jgi:hypothetical protein
MQLIPFHSWPCSKTAAIFSKTQLSSWKWLLNSLNIVGSTLQVSFDSLWLQGYLALKPSLNLRLDCFIMV